MADYYIDRCQKCGGRPLARVENGNILIQCEKCGHTVKVCAEAELLDNGGGLKTVIPLDKGIEALNKWNKGGMTYRR